MKVTRFPEFTSWVTWHPFILGMKSYCIHLAPSAEYPLGLALPAPAQISFKLCALERQ